MDPSDGIAESCNEKEDEQRLCDEQLEHQERCGYGLQHACSHGVTHVKRSCFGVLPDGRNVDAFTLDDGGGIVMQVITYGATIISLATPDRARRCDDIVLGHDTIDGYLEHKTYFGAVVGRHANRIRRGRFSLNGRGFQLSTNEGQNHLHGGVSGFDAKLWTAEVDEARGAVSFSLQSADGDEGYPGRLEARVTYCLAAGDGLRIDYAATSDAPTPVNLTQHSYFDLSGGAAADILAHELMLNADAFTPVDDELLVTGMIAPVSGTAFDFTTRQAIGDRIGGDDAQLRYAGGYDHNWVLRQGAEPLRHAAHLREPKSGRTLDVFTTAPGLQFYSGNKLDGSVMGRDGRPYRHRAGLCLETQGFPDAPNHPHFPSAILRPGELFRSTTVWRFGNCS